MGLTIKSFKDIMTSLVDWTTNNTSKLTDFTNGSAIRTLYEAVAAEIEQFYFNMYKNMNWAIENAIYETLGFTPIPAQAASGTVTLTFAQPLESNMFLPKGTKFATVPITDTGVDILYFVTTQDYTVLAGSTSADIQVTCTQPGTIGNVSANTIRIMINPNSLIASVTNRQAFFNGTEQETQAERKARFNKFIQTLNRGTVKAIEYGALEVSGVAGAYVDDTSEIGVVNVYCHDSNGDLPPALASAISANLEFYRPAGIPCNVLPIVKVPVDLSLMVMVDPAFNNTSFQQTIENSILTYINAFPVARSLYLSQLITYVMNLDTVAIKDVQIMSPNSDVIAGTMQIIRPNNLTVTLQNAPAGA